MDAGEKAALLEQLGGSWAEARDAQRELRRREAAGEDVSFAFPALAVERYHHLVLLRDLVRAGHDPSPVRAAVEQMAQTPGPPGANRTLAREIRDLLDEADGRLQPVEALPEAALGLGEGHSLVGVSRRPRLAPPDSEEEAHRREPRPCAVCGERGQLWLAWGDDVGIKGAGGSDVVDETEEFRCAACGCYTTYHYFDRY